jgi:hypothetical protein
LIQVKMTTGGRTGLDMIVPDPVPCEPRVKDTTAFDDTNRNTGGWKFQVPVRPDIFNVTGLPRQLGDSQVDCPAWPEGAASCRLSRRAVKLRP